MYQVGDSVKVKAPFSEQFSGTYVVTEVVHSPDATVTYILGEAGGFDAMYLEAA